MVRTNCPNCGAPIDRNHVKCQYCGTPYEVESAVITFVDMPERVNGVLPLTTDIVLTPDEIQRRFARQISHIHYDRYIEELYTEAISAMRQYSGNSDEEVLRHVEENIAMVNDSLECITDKIQMGHFCGNLIFVLVMMAPVIITALLILIK